MTKNQKGTRNLAGTCIQCKRKAVFDVLATEVVVDKSGNSEPAEYKFAKCQDCCEVALFVRFYDGQSFDNDEYQREYPSLRRPLPFKVPIKVRRAYLEATRCEEAQTWDACGAMAGKALEALAREFKADTKRFAVALKAMHDAGVISDEMFDWAHHVWLVRNEGAHPDSSRVSEADAREALDLAQAIIEVLFVIRPKYKKMRERRKK